MKLGLNPSHGDWPFPIASKSGKAVNVSPDISSFIKKKRQGGVGEREAAARPGTPKEGGGGGGFPPPPGLDGLLLPRLRGVGAARAGDGDNQ